MAYICEQSEEGLLSFPQQQLSSYCNKSPKYSQISLCNAAACSSEVMCIVSTRRSNTWAHGLMQNILKAAKHSH